MADMQACVVLLSLFVVVCPSPWHRACQPVGLDEGCRVDSPPCGCCCWHGLSADVVVHANLSLFFWVAGGRVLCLTCQGMGRLVHPHGRLGTRVKLAVWVVELVEETSRPSRWAWEAACTAHSCILHHCLAAGARVCELACGATARFLTQFMYLLLRSGV